MAIFKNEKALMPDYVPEKLPFRDEQLKMLQAYFGSFIKEPGSMYVKTIMVGRSGSGKTVTSRKFGSYVKTASKGLVDYVHISCALHRTPFSVLKTIGLSLNLPIPRRGFSSEELLELIIDKVAEKNKYAVIVLDDVFYLFNYGGPDSIDALVRLGEEYYDKNYRFSLLLVSQSKSFMDQLNKGVKSSLGNAIIEFPPYTKDQIFEILLNRAQEALNDTAYTEEILEMISDVAGVDPDNPNQSTVRGDARYALDILWRASKLAEVSGATHVFPSHIREAVMQTLHGVREDELMSLPLHEKLLLLAIVNRLMRESETPYISIGDAESEYEMVCEQYGQEPRKHTQLWEYVKDMASRGILETRLSGKGMRGRTTFISIPTEPLETMQQSLSSMIRRDLGD